MRAALLLDYAEPLVCEEVAATALDDHEVRVRVDASGVCHSDLSVLQGKVKMPVPTILGHEGTGIVTEVGDAVRRARVGDRVIVSFHPTCGTCWYCRHGHPNHCEHDIGATVPRAHRAGGGDVHTMLGLGTFAEEMKVPEFQVVPVRTDLPAEQLALIGCAVTTGLGAALNTARVTPGAVVAVIGCGGVGQAVIQGARIAGAARIIAVDPVASKREQAQTCGATDLVDPAAGDVVAALREATGGRGADFTFEVVGSPDLALQGFKGTRKAGTVTLVGMPSTDATLALPAFRLFSDEKRVLGCWYGSASVDRDFQRCIDLVESGRLDIGTLVTRRIGLADLNEAFDDMVEGRVIRSVVV
jgi:S-(hydroxymethyl)glutathione dehydrogenase/alcohol dehydrogenase